MTQDTRRAIALHLAVIGILFGAQFFVSDYVHLSLTRIMLLTIFAMGYNLLFGYAGMLSLGHAMFFAVGLYVSALGVTRTGLGVITVFFASVGAGAIFSLVVGAVALRAKGVAFMIVTLMFSQAAYLTILYFGQYTRGDEGIVIPDSLRHIAVGKLDLDLANPVTRYNLSLFLLSICLIGCLAIVRSPMGRVLVAIRENESRTEMLGYNIRSYKLATIVISGTLSATAGSAYALMFAFAGASFASIQYSIHPLLWTLLGGPATTLGPLIGTAIMFTLTSIVSGFTTANLLAVGVVLILLVVFFPQGLLGAARQKWIRWLP
jgi:branched-chain amino acid transport system permease protein